MNSGSSCLLFASFLLAFASGQLFPRPYPLQTLQHVIATRFQNAMNPFTFAVAEDVCETGRGIVGSCVTARQCRTRKGLNHDRSGCSLTKICCEETQTCHDTATRNNTYFVSPSNTGPQQTLQCPLTVKKLLGVCQLRLDFEKFSLRGPDTVTGKCDSDRFTVTGQEMNSVFPQFCGENTGQHAYLDVSTAKGPFSLMVTTSDKLASSTMSRQWRVRVSQIPCNSPMQAPQGCLQYFTGSSSSINNNDIRSVNYGNTRTGETTYPAGLNYAVCIRKELGLCFASFESQNKLGIHATETDAVASGENTCQHDYVFIGETRYCGGTKLPEAGQPAPRTTGHGPLIMRVVSSPDFKRDPNVIWPGFEIRYKQEICNIA